MAVTSYPAHPTDYCVVKMKAPEAEGQPVLSGGERSQSYQVHKPVGEPVFSLGKFDERSGSPRQDNRAYTTSVTLGPVSERYHPP
jgi:hypothetical protein